MDSDFLPKKDKFPDAPQSVPMKGGDIIAYFDKWDGFIGQLTGKSEVREQPAYSTPEQKHAKFFEVTKLYGWWHQDTSWCTASSDVARYSWCLFHGNGEIASRLTRNPSKTSIDVEDKRGDIKRERKLLIRWIFTWKDEE